MRLDPEGHDTAALHQLLPDLRGWLLDSDPSIRWQVMRDLISASDASVARERLRVASEGWGARLLDLQGADGHWGGAAFVPHAWISTQDTLQLLRDLGVDPASDRVRRAIGQVRERCTWGEAFGDSPFFEGEVEPCINGRVLAIGAYFGEASDRLADRLLQEQLSDGGWNCDAPRSQRSSFHTTICVLEGLLDTRRRRVRCLTSPAPAFADRNISSSAACSDRDRLDRLSASIGSSGGRPRGRSVRFPRAGTTTSCGGWTICAERASRRTSASPRRSIWWRRSVTRTGDGRSRIRTRASCTSSLKAPASQAAGTPFERSGCCAGRVPRRLQTRATSAPAGARRRIPGSAPRRRGGASASMSTRSQPARSAMNVSRRMPASSRS